MGDMILILQVVGWCILFASLVFTVTVWLIHLKGRNTPWVRVVQGDEVDYVSREGGEDWREVLADALTDGLKIDEIVLRYRGGPRISLGIKSAIIGSEWDLASTDRAMLLIRVTIPGEAWQQSLEASKVLDSEYPDVPHELKDRVGRLEGVTARWNDAVVRLRAPQVVVDVPAVISADYRVSPRWVESLRMIDNASLYVVAATVAAIGSVLTLTGIGIASGVVVFVALSGVCKFIFMSRRSDPTREEYLQNY